MDLFYRKNGIIHETTNLHLPEQNDIAEHDSYGMVCCMFHVVSVDLCYWGEAFMYVVHIHSLMATSGLEDVVNVPYKSWTSRQLDVSHLRIWESFRWAHVPKQVQKGKLESRAVSVGLLGW